MAGLTAPVIYARISKDGAGEHLGVDRQERLCRDLADTAGLTVVDVSVDNDVSAYARKPRPAFERLVDMLRAGEAGAVVTYHADRLYRRTTDLERLVDLVEASGALGGKSLEQIEGVIIGHRL
jgi:site-specific DNA recombinase